MPQFYHALYVEKLEMMYFLIEPIIMKAGYLNINTASDIEITNALKEWCNPVKANHEIFKKILW